MPGVQLSLGVKKDEGDATGITPNYAKLTFMCQLSFLLFFICTGSGHPYA